MPNLFILAGPNGAGKSTSAPRILSGARRVDEFVNADVIAKEEGVSEIEAGCHLTFCWLPNADMAVMRVARRVAAGGHSIPEEAIRRRYERGLENLFSDYLGISDTWRIVDNTAPPPGRLIAWRDFGAEVQIAEAGIWTTLAARYMKPRAEEPVTQIASTEEVSWTSQDIMDAINEAVTEALRRHKARGESIVIWRDGKIVTLRPEEIDV